MWLLVFFCKFVLYFNDIMSQENQAYNNVLELIGNTPIKLKFIPNLGKFEDLGGFDSPFEFQSKLNPENKLSDFSEPSNKDRNN